MSDRYEAAAAALREYVKEADSPADMILPIVAAFAIADKTKSHKILLGWIYGQLCLRYGHERTGRRFTKMGTRAYAKKDRATTLIMTYLYSGKSQEEFARWAVQYNKENPRPKRLGTQTTNEKAMLRALKRALHDHPELVAITKKVNELEKTMAPPLPPGT